MTLLLGFLTGFVAAVLVHHWRNHGLPYVRHEPTTYVMSDTPRNISHLPSIRIPHNHAP